MPVPNAEKYEFFDKEYNVYNEERVYTGVLYFGFVMRGSRTMNDEQNIIGGNRRDIITEMMRDYYRRVNGDVFMDIMRAMGQTVQHYSRNEDVRIVD